MRKEIFVNEGGINGSPNGRFDTNSDDFQILKAKILEEASKIPPKKRIEMTISGIRFQMERYLDDTGLPPPNDAPTLLSECIEAIGVKKKVFADYVGIEDSNLSATLKGRRRISPEFALKLEQIFDISANLWLSVQSKNELDLLRKSKSLLEPKLSRTELLAKAS